MEIETNKEMEVEMMEVWAKEMDVGIISILVIVKAIREN